MDKKQVEECCEIGVKETLSRCTLIGMHERQPPESYMYTPPQFTAKYKKPTAHNERKHTYC
jgi:hypothetical protein